MYFLPHSANPTATSNGSMITIISAIVGMLLGTAGFVIGVMNYLRDKPRVKVILKWDMRVTDNARYDASKLWGIITVTNIGRRPIFISIAALTVRKGFEHSHLIVVESVTGQKLSEGDAPVRFVVKQEGLEKYRRSWRDVRAHVEDSAGAKYLSKRLNKSGVPSWAKNQ